MPIIIPPALKKGDTVGIAAPCLAIDEKDLIACEQTLSALGLKVKRAKHVMSRDAGFAGTIAQRASDFNDMLRDDSVAMLTFGGGEVGNEILPYIDYDALRAHPKIVAGFSDGTTPINALLSRAGVAVYYGLSPSFFAPDADAYRIRQFKRTLMEGQTNYERRGAFDVLHGGRCRGVLTGGYLANYALMQNGAYFSFDKQTDYILVIEEHIWFTVPAAVSKYFRHLQQSGLMERVRGVMFGHYDESPQPLLDGFLRDFARELDVPFVRTDDFGHGAPGAVFPLGVEAELDADAGTLTYMQKPVTL